MADLLEVKTTSVLSELRAEVLLLEPQGQDEVLEVQTEQVLYERGAQDSLIEVVPEVVLLSDQGQGPPGPQGPIGPAGGTAMQRTAGHAVSALRVVYEDDQGRVHYLSNTDEVHIFCLLGVTLNAADEGGLVNVQRAGVLDDSAWGWAARQRVYLGDNGSLVSDPAERGCHVLVGVAVSPTRLLLQLQDPVMLAAEEETLEGG